jgi:hypothetical protein
MVSDRVFCTANNWLAKMTPLAVFRVVSGVCVSDPIYMYVTRVVPGWVGVPVMRPVEKLAVSPAGSGSTVHEAPCPALGSTPIRCTVAEYGTPTVPTGSSVVVMGLWSDPATPLRIVSNIIRSA